MAAWSPREGQSSGTLRAFFRFAVAREWLIKNSVTSDPKPPLGANPVANEFPFTDEELDRIYGRAIGSGLPSGRTATQPVSGPEKT